jgi:hypothetical protein
LSPPTATILRLSAEQATASQVLFGAELCVQVVPEFVEIQIPPPLTDAIILVPFVEQAKEAQALLDAVAIQFDPEFVET